MLVTHATMSIMTTASTKKKTKKTTSEADSTYFLKLILYMILGSLWIRFARPMEIGAVTLTGAPFGLLLGLVFASHDHFQVDRKIEYALLLIMMIITYFLPAGIVI